MGSEEEESKDGDPQPWVFASVCLCLGLRHSCLQSRSGQHPGSLPRGLGLQLPNCLSHGLCLAGEFFNKRAPCSPLVSRGYFYTLKSFQRCYKGLILIFKNPSQCFPRPGDTLPLIPSTAWVPPGILPDPEIGQEEADTPTPMQAGLSPLAHSHGQQFISEDWECRPWTQPG